MSDTVEDACGSGSPFDGRLNLRVASIFVILVTSALGTLFPIMMRRSTRINCPEVVYATLKSFGSGIIIATAFIHLLAPAFESLGSECLTGTWGDYSWAPAIAMSSLFAIFLVELVATRTGTKYLRKRGLKAHDPHHSKKNERGHTQHGVHIPQTRPSSPTEAPLVVVAASSDAGSVGTEDTAVEVLQIEAPNGGLLASDGKIVDLEEAAVPATGTAQHGHGHSHGHGHADDAMSESALAQILGVAILEFGVLFHSFVIGLTLAVTSNFPPLFAVLTVHQTCEGLGLGTRLSGMPLPRKYRSVPYIAAVVYACTTPLGIAIGLGIRNTYNPDSAIALIVSGVLDATSAGVLIYAGTVECVAHDFIFSSEMNEASDAYVAACVFAMLFGAGIMATLGRWA